MVVRTRQRLLTAWAGGIVRGHFRREIPTALGLVRSYAAGLGRASRGVERPSCGNGDCQSKLEYLGREDRLLPILQRHQ
jgi:hypothetical protein